MGEKTALHSKRLKKNNRGDMKIRHQHSDNSSEITSANSNISQALSTRKPTKPQPIITRNRKPSPTPNTPALSSTSRPCTSKSKRNRRAPDYYGFKSSVFSVSDQDVAPTARHPRSKIILMRR